eukprot:scaffold192370_cov31-Tisochrysis_lutea.AAC.3
MVVRLRKDCRLLQSDVVKPVVVRVGVRLDLLRGDAYRRWRAGAARGAPGALGQGAHRFFVCKPFLGCHDVLNAPPVAVLLLKLYVLLVDLDRLSQMERWRFGPGFVYPSPKVGSGQRI